MEENSNPIVPTLREENNNNNFVHSQPIFFTYFWHMYTVGNLQLEEI